MGSEQPPRDAARASILAKIAAWQAALASYDAATSMDGSAEAGGSGAASHGEPGKAIDLPVGVFRGKSIPEAIEIFLAAGRRKQTNKEIAAGLRQGGIASTSSNFEATLATALGRMREDGKLLRFPDGWDLASSYPESLRSRLDKEVKPKPKTKAKKKASSQAKTSAKAAPAGAKAEAMDKTAVAATIISAAGAAGVSISELYEAMQKRGADCERKYVRGILHRLSGLEKVEQREGRGGRYFWKTAQEPKLRAI